MAEAIDNATIDDAEGKDSRKYPWLKWGVIAVLVIAFGVHEILASHGVRWADAAFMIFVATLGAAGVPLISAGQRCLRMRWYWLLFAGLMLCHCIAMFGMWWLTFETNPHPRISGLMLVRGPGELGLIEGVLFMVLLEGARWVVEDWHSPGNGG